MIHPERICCLLLLFGIFVDQTSASNRAIRGVTRIASRQLLEDQGTTINVRAQDKNGKEDKEDEEEETPVPTESPTDEPTESPTDRPTTYVPSWSPSVQLTATPTALEDTASPTTSFPTPNPSTSETIQDTPAPSVLTVVDDTSSPSNATATVIPTTADTPIVSPNAGAVNPDDAGKNSTSVDDIPPAKTPDPLETAATTTMSTRGASRGALIGLVAAVGTLSCLWSIYFVSKQKQSKEAGGDTMSEESMTAVPPPPQQMRSWSDVFHHSLAEEEKIEVSQTCRTKSLCQDTIIEELQTGDMEDVTLSSPKQERVVLRAVQHEMAPSDGDGSKEETFDDAITPDSYTRAVANLLGCGVTPRGTDSDDEMKTEADMETQSISSEDLEYLYGTLPSDHLPETPRRSNVSPEGKKQGSQRSTISSLHTPSLYPATNLLGPETNAENEGEEHEPFWV